MNKHSWMEIAGQGVSREIQIMLQTLDMVVPNGKGSYLAAPISTGKRYYEALARTGTANHAELIAAIGHDSYLQTVRWPNVADGECLAAKLRQDGVKYLINTGPLMVSGWQGHDYMEACFALIERKIQTVYFHEDWPFSSGAVDEFLFCSRRDIRCLQVDGKPLTTGAAHVQMQRAREYVKSIGAPASRLERKIEEMETLLLLSPVR